MKVDDHKSTAIDNAILVVAHPDDEILWFGSVVDKIDRIVICFAHDPSQPGLSDARMRTLARHPMADRIVSLGLTETATFGKAVWPLPEDTVAGLRIEGNRELRHGYERTAEALRAALRPLVADCKNVFTHNPWGEYGHEEHVLVHRVTSDLALQAGKAAWYDNYVSSWSAALMAQYFDRQPRTGFSAPVDVESMHEIAAIYRAENAWTWFDDYRWFAREHFVRAPLERRPGSQFGWMMPVNFIELSDRDLPKRASGLRRARGAIRRVLPGTGK